MPRIRPRDGYEWTLEKVVAELQQLHAGGQSMTYSALRDGGFGHVATAAERYAGSMSRALKLAGIVHVPRPVWNRKSVIAEICRLNAEGVPLSSQHLTTSGHSGVVAAARKHFGGWPEAVAAAGFPKYTNATYKTWDAIRDELRALHARGLKMSSVSLIEGGHDTLVHAARAMAGGWNAALTKAGVPLVMKYRHWTAAQVKDELRRLHADGVPLGWNILLSHDRRDLANAALRYFKTWDAACSAAIEDHEPATRKWSVEKLIEEIRERHRDGKSVRSTDVQRDDAALTFAARRLGLKWRAACRRAGVPASAIEPIVAKHRVRWTDSMISSALHSAAANGLPLHVAWFPPGFVGAAHRHFGSWNQAIEAAGLREVHERDLADAKARRLGGVFVTGQQMRAAAARRARRRAR